MKIKDPITKEDIITVMNGIRHKQLTQARMLVYITWATGAQPCEIVNLRAEDIKKVGEQIRIKFKSVIIFLPLDDEYVYELWRYASSFPLDMYLFWFFRGSRNDASNMLYWFIQWFKVINRYVYPMFLRYNRLTLAAKFMTLDEVRLLRGAKQFKTVLSYFEKSRRGTVTLTKEHLE